jgi:hypothetical protein
MALYGSIAIGCVLHYKRCQMKKSIITKLTDFLKSLTMPLLIIFLICGIICYKLSFEYIALFFALCVLLFFKVEILEIAGIVKFKQKLEQEISELEKVLAVRTLNLIAMGSGRLSSGSLNSFEETSKQIEQVRKVLGPLSESPEVKAALDQANKIMLFDLVSHYHVMWQSLEKQKDNDYPWDESKFLGKMEETINKLEIDAQDNPNKLKVLKKIKSVWGELKRSNL